MLLDVCRASFSGSMVGRLNGLIFLVGCGVRVTYLPWEQ